MKYLFTVLTVLFTMSCWGQQPPVLRSPWTTNTVPNRGTFTNATIGFLTNTTLQEISIKNFGYANARGAVGGGRWVNHAYATNDNRTITIVGTDTPFTAADVGKILMIEWGGTNGIHYHSSGISNFISSTQVALSNAPVYSVTNWNAWVGFDDTPAFQAMVNWTCTNVVGKWKVVFDDDGYTIAGPLQDYGVYTNHHNAQVYAPDVVNGQERSKLIHWAGVGPQIEGAVRLTPQGGAQATGYVKKRVGTTIVSTLCYAAEDDWHQSAVFQWKNSTPLARTFPTTLVAFNDLSIVLENIWFRQAFNNNLMMFDAAGTVNGPMVYNCVFDAGWGNGAEGYVPYCTETNTMGLAMSQIFNDNRLEIVNTHFAFFHTALMVGENTRIMGVQFFFNENAINFLNTGGNLVTLLGYNLFGDNTYCFSRPGSTVHLDGIANIQNNVVTNFWLFWDVLSDVPATNANFSGDFVAYYSSPVRGKIETASTHMRVTEFLVEQGGTLTGPIQTSGNQLFKVPTTVQGAFTSQTNIWFAGSDSTNSTLTANSDKLAIFGMPRYSTATYGAAWGSVIATAGAVQGKWGRDESGKTAFGLTEHDFYTSASADGSNPALRWQILTDGQMKAYPTHNATIARPGGGYPMLHAMYSTNYIIGKTNAAPSVTTTVSWMVITNQTDGRAYAVPLAAWP